MKKNVLTKNIQAALAVSALGLSSVTVPQLAYAGEFTDALTGGVASVDARVRYEGVSQDGKEDASAFTERTRLGYLTGDFKGFTGFIEMSDTAALGSREDYYVPKGSYAGGDPAKAVVLDPTFTALNQAWISYKFDETTVKAGEQRIIFDNRFLGNVGWRQKEQTYSGVSIHAESIPKTTLDYAYIVNANNVIGSDVAMSTHAFQAAFNGLPFGKVTGYAYLIDNDVATSTDSQTLGARFNGATSLSEDLKVKYHIEYASQDDYADSKSVGGEYMRTELGLMYKTGSITLGQEKLGGNGVSAFQTPLGTVHAFNGWADMFIGPVGGTPKNGLVDNYINLSGKALGLKMAAIYHDFSSDVGGEQYGTEYDLLVAKKFSKTYTTGIKYAAYSADTYLKDTNKLWVWVDVKF